MTKTIGKLESFFSIAFDFIITGQELPYDIYINSSSRASKDRFVRIFPMGGTLQLDDLVNFKQKYSRPYILESQRDAYLQSLASCENITTKEKTKIIKDSAIIYLNRIFDEEEFTSEILEEAIAGCRESVESLIDVLSEEDVSSVQKLIGDLSFHDFYTYDHSINVSMYSITILKSIKPNASRSELLIIGLGGMLHDLGKIKIPTHIINSSNSLTDEEFALIKEHPDHGKKLFAEADEDCCPELNFSVVSRIIYEHHENFNGSGYPTKLAGEEIHIMARIAAIADFFDAITTKRSYHDVLNTADALALMEKSAGKKLDPRLFSHFKNNIKDLTGKAREDLKLPDDFDPCQPQNILPFEAIKAESQSSNFLKKKAEPEFGKVSSNKDFSKKSA